MKANELRIENYVLDDHNGICQVKIIDVINDSYGLVKYKSTICLRYNLTQINPIPLTKEWLLKAGFVFGMLTDEGLFYSKNGITILITHDGKKFFLYGKDKIIKYVHQLQNLYFDKTDEELEIKAPCPATQS